MPRCRTRTRISYIFLANVSDIIRTYQGITLQLKREDRTKATYGLLVSSLRQVWYGTLATLYELQAHTYASERDGLIVIWRRFGVAAGLDEKVEMRRATHLCSRIYCRHHFFFTEKPTPTCKGCGTVVRHSVVSHGRYVVLK